MRSFRVTASVLALATLATTRQLTAQDRFNAGLVPSNYLRVSVGSVTPVNPEGSLKEWDAGQGVNVMWENWATGSGGVARLGFGIFVDYAMLPFNEAQFKADFTQGPNGRVTSASAGRAGVLQFGLNTRLRIPMSFVMPSISASFGFLDWRPSEITYTAENGTTAKAKQQHRSGGALTIGAGLDAHVFNRVAVFGEAIYTYAYTSFGQGLAASGSSCVQQNCDLLKNTSLGTIRGGMRLRMGR
jgi:hypothetical protein